MAITVSFMSDSQQDEALVGLTVKQAREQYAPMFAIPLDAVPMVNNKQVDDNFVLQDGDKLEFSKNVKKY